MSCRGVFFALSQAQDAKLIEARGDQELLNIVQEDIERAWDTDWLVETDKAWDAIHRCLSDGTLSCPGQSVLEQCVLGGRQLYTGDDYIVSYLTSSEVEEVARALQPLDESWLRNRYRSIDPSDYGMDLSQDDENYTWEYFLETKEFFKKASGSGRSIIFSVGQ